MSVEDLETQKERTLENIKHDLYVPTNKKTIALALGIARRLTPLKLIDPKTFETVNSAGKPFVDFKNNQYIFFDGVYYYYVPLIVVLGDSNIVYRRAAGIFTEIEDPNVSFQKAVLHIVPKIWLNVVHSSKDQPNDLVDGWEEGGHAFLHPTTLGYLRHDILAMYNVEA